MMVQLVCDENGNAARIDTPNEYVYVNTPSGQEPLNRWHTHGPGNASQLDPLCKLAQQKLQNRTLPVHVGNTGYINLNEQTTHFPDGWCLDDLNRTVFIFNNVLYFQRYETGGPIMHNPLAQGCFNEVLRSEARTSLENSLQNL